MTTQEKIQQLETELRQLLDGKSFREPENLAKLKDLDAKIKHYKRLDKLEQFNAGESRKREAIKTEVLPALDEISILSPDDLTNDGKIHKAKVKKYPLLSASWHSFKFSGEGENRHVYTYKNHTVGIWCPEIEKTRLCANLSELLKVNDISPKDLTLKDVEKRLNAISKGREEFKKAIDKWEKVLKQQNASELSRAQLVYISNMRSITDAS